MIGYYEGQCTFKDVWTMLDALDYSFAGNLEQWYASDGHVIFADALFVKTAELPPPILQVKHPA